MSIPKWIGSPFSIDFDDALTLYLPCLIRYLQLFLLNKECKNPNLWPFPTSAISWFIANKAKKACGGILVKTYDGEQKVTGVGSFIILWKALPSVQKEALTFLISLLNSSPHACLPLARPFFLGPTTSIQAPATPAILQPPWDISVLSQKSVF